MLFVIEVWKEIKDMLFHSAFFFLNLWRLWRYSLPLEGRVQRKLEPFTTSWLGYILTLQNRHWCDWNGCESVALFLWQYFLGSRWSQAACSLSYWFHCQESWCQIHATLQEEYCIPILWRFREGKSQHWILFGHFWSRATIHPYLEGAQWPCLER